MLRAAGLPFTVLAVVQTAMMHMTSPGTAPWACQVFNLRLQQLTS